MTNAWDDRKKALENDFFHKKEREAFDNAKTSATKNASLGHCPKCGELLEPTTFHGVPLDQCQDCGGVWLGPSDFRKLAAKDHRDWFARWFEK